ncbi:piggyBac transposable element-derived protein 4-like [Bradysia coprophila]|uniref:piggyBac transposable element-derived protein 4-like n=1 Tax=Bradysia coprophila TaxID=38358 RepID=UPI00187DD76E|nr:piggyBac transposable element-derived protein 4-like [Bradysia coprophila]
MSGIVTETNRYAQQNNSKNWIDVTAEEMKAFIGCLIVMGIHQLPALKHYWSSDPFLHVESVASVMTASRFKKIVENLHCNDNKVQPPKSDPNYDKLHKVKPLLESLNENVRKVYQPSAVVTIDESMIPFKGRYTLKQYMPNKPIKWGYKVWCLCDSYTGFVIAFFVYTGKDDTPKNITLGEKVVTKLVEAAKIERIPAVLCLKI